VLETLVWISYVSRITLAYTYLVTYFVDERITSTLFCSCIFELRFGDVYTTFVQCQYKRDLWYKFNPNILKTYINLFKRLVFSIFLFLIMTVCLSVTCLRIAKAQSPNLTPQPAVDPQWIGRHGHVRALLSSDMIHGQRLWI